MTNFVGLQLYTVRDETAKDFKKTISRVAEIGYAGVEFAGYGDLSSKEMAALLADTGLRALGTHVSLAALENDFDHELNYCIDIGCSLLVVPYLDNTWRNGAGFKRLAERLNEFGQRSHERGVTLAYHNHDFEFQKEGEETLLNQLVETTEAELVKFELDTFWAAYAGIDPIALIKQLKGRLATLHLKDMTPDRKFAEVGDGTLDIAGFVEAGKESGAHIFLVENDQPAIPSLESARRSFVNLESSLT